MVRAWSDCWERVEDVLPAVRHCAGAIIPRNYWLSADDLVQHACQKLVEKKLPRDFPNATDLKFWLCKVVRNKLRDHRRGQRNRRCVSLDEATLPAQQKKELSETCSREQDHDVEVLLRSGIDDEAARNIIRLVYYEGLSISEIAEFLDISPGAARKRISRAKEVLWARLGKDWR